MVAARPGPARIALTCAAAVAVLGVATCLSWWLGMPQVNQLVSASSLVRFNTGLSFLFEAVALVMMLRRPTWLGLLWLAPAVLLAAGTLAEYAIGVDLGIDQLFIAGVSAPWPGRMAPNTSLGFLFGGVAIALLGSGQRRIWVLSIASMLAALTLALGASAALGYLFDLTATFEWFGLTRMALATALGMTVLGTGIVFGCVEVGRRAAWHELPWFGSSIGVALAAIGALAARALHNELLALPISTVDLMATAALFTAMFLSATIAQARYLRLLTGRLEQANRTLAAQASEISDLYEHAPCGYHSITADGRIVRINRTELDWLGYQAEELVGHSILPLLTPASQAILERLLPQLIRAGEVREVEIELLRKDGSVLPVLVSASAVYDRDGHFLHSRSTLFDITSRREAERDARLLAAVVEHSDEAIISTSVDGIVTSWNRAAERLYGHSAAEMLAQPFASVVPGLQQAKAAALRARAAAGETVAAAECRHRRRDGDEIDVSVTISPLFDAAGRVVGLSYISRDIGVRKRFEQALRDSEQRLQQLLDSVQAAVVLHGPDTAIEFVNPTAAKLLGLQRDDLLGKTTSDPAWHFVREDGSPMPIEELPASRVLASGTALHDYVVGIAEPDRPTRWLLVDAVPLLGADARVQQVVVSFVDISDRTRAAHRLQTLALTDPLTGLASRRHFDAEAEREFARSRRTGEPLAVIMLDLDHFKQINDRHGHGTGDRVLQTLADVLRGNLRQVDLPCRWGGEEICVLLPQATRAHALEAAERIRATIAATTVPAPDGRRVPVTASLGVAEIGPEDRDVAALVGRADQALYAAKRGGRDRVCAAGVAVSNQVVSDS